ncbi:MAG TPA: aminotransferase class I/II-fold pyridoxal phosphate-dependent enzyme [Egibacteraceae bacterium]|nr:aminotransferase class I/II-fold pyridoxal phosphate-dependent enzyme [Actinomycetota bacterium]HWB71273.1 aminotransferase class I/II-fold pyridoxal phosphate-dependent enzyme [Egibacteraceae bacterium]
MNPLLRRLGGYPLAAYQDLKAELAADGGPLHDFSIGDPIEPTPAFIRRALIEGVGEVSQYPTASGLPALRSAIAGWVGRRFGVTVDPDTQVLPTAGSKEAIFHLPLGIVDPTGDRRAVLWGAPGYPVYERGQLFAGGTSDPVTLSAEHGWRLELATLDPRRLQAACLTWLNYPHNPTGAAVDTQFYRRALETARAHGLVLASDECYADVYADGGALPPSLLQVADADLTGVVVAFSLSKRSGMTGYRSGALVGDAELIAAQRTLRPNIGTASPEFVQHAAVAAWNDDAHAAQRRAVFDAKRTIVLGFLDEAGLTVSGSEATFYVWFAAPGGDDAAYVRALLGHRIIASPGAAFGPAGRGWLRLALVPSVDGCREAIALWREAIASGTLPGHG